MTHYKQQPKFHYGRQSDPKPNINKTSFYIAVLSVKFGENIRIDWNKLHRNIPSFQCT